LPPTAAPRVNATPVHEARRAFANGDLASTERICSEVLAQAPDDGNAWALLTETALLRGRPDAAIVCADRAVALMPKDPIAHVLRAKCRLVRGEARQAYEATDAASIMAGDAPATLDAVGAMFGLLGFHQRAKEFFRRAAATVPAVPQYLFNLAATERMIGALDAAERHCDAAIALDPHYALAHYLRSDLRTHTADRNHIAEMEALIGDGRLAPPSAILLHFALAKEYEDLDRQSRAFASVEAGCQLQHRSMPHDHAAGLAEIDRIIRTHTRSWIRTASPGYSAAAPVFVAGLPRTGTTLVERIIASHPAIGSVGETGAFAAELRRATKGPSADGDPREIGRRYLDAVTAARALQQGRFIDKTLQNYLYCGLIHAALPAARIILVQRHPIDACWAIYKAHFRGQFPFSYHQIELAEYYLAYRRLSRHWRATLPPDVFLEINYEDIVRDQAAASRRLLAFVGLPWDDEVLRFHESPAPSATASAVQVRRPIYSSSLGRWRLHAEHLAPLRARLAREIPEAELQ
jgi:tetratricopeptide (TPR) repeat protein